MDFQEWAQKQGLDISKLVTSKEDFAEARTKWQAEQPKKVQASAPSGGSHLILYIAGKHTSEIKLKKGRSVERDTLMEQYRMAIDAGMNAAVIRQSDDGLLVEISKPEITADALGAFCCGDSKAATPPGTVKRGKK